MHCARRLRTALALLPCVVLGACISGPGAPLPAINKDEFRCPPSTLELCLGDSDSRIDNERHEEMRFCTCQAAF